MQNKSMFTGIERPQVSIIIRSKNEEHFVGQTLESIFNQSIDIPFEVIVIDSGSNDRTLDIVRKFKVRLFEIEPDKFTFGFALNYGVKLAIGKYIINLSAHCIPVNSKWMANLLYPLLSDLSIGATYGKQEPIKGLNPFEEQSLITDFDPNEKYKIRPIFSNANCAIKKRVWEKYPFDENASFSEDFIWAKMLPSKYKIKYVHSASVYHSHPLSYKYWAKRYYDNGLLKEYLELVYNIRYPWQKQISEDQSQIAKDILIDIKANIAELLSSLRFLNKHGYYFHIPLLPFFIIFRRYYKKKGMKDGRKIYSSFQEQAK